MSDYEETATGVLELDEMSGADMLKKVASMFDTSVDPKSAFLDVRFKDTWGVRQIMRMYLVELHDDGKTLH